MIKKIMILGASGSIGQSAIKILKDYPDRYRLTTATAHTNSGALDNVKKIFPECKTLLTSSIEDENQWYDIIEKDPSCLVLNGITGAAGLIPSLATLKAGKNLALANKESMVMAGRHIHDEAKKSGSRIIPVDSEHSALFFLLENRDRKDIKELVLTASGGPFLKRPRSELVNVTLKEALNHPNWSMGPKITIDSATMANKGLEVIEAERLFRIEPERIKVIIHPQSFIHSLIRTIDGALYAQMSMPDMSLPIQNSFSYPELHQVRNIDLELSGKQMDFIEPDLEKYPMLKHSFEALRSGEGYTIAYNAANEIAVEAFIKDKISYMEIPEVTEEILHGDFPALTDSLESVLEIDNKTRILARDIIQRKQ